MGTAKARGSLADRIAQSKARTERLRALWLEADAALNDAKLCANPKDAEPFITRAVAAREEFYRLRGR